VRVCVCAYTHTYIYMYRYVYIHASVSIEAGGGCSATSAGRVHGTGGDGVGCARGGKWFEEGFVYCLLA